MKDVSDSEAEDASFNVEWEAWMSSLESFRMSLPAPACESAAIYCEAWFEHDDAELDWEPLP